VERVAITHAEPAPLARLFRATVVDYVRAPHVLQLQLDVCNALVEAIRIYPRGCRASEAAARVLAHCAGPNGASRNA
jgi:hypothetical protein